MDQAVLVHVAENTKHIQVGAPVACKKIYFSNLLEIRMLLKQARKGFQPLSVMKELFTFL